MNGQTDAKTVRHIDRPSYNDTDTTLTPRYSPNPTRTLVLLPEMVLLKESGFFHVSVSFSVVRRRLILTSKNRHGKYLCIGQSQIELRRTV